MAAQPLNVANFFPSRAAAAASAAITPSIRAEAVSLFKQQTAAASTPKTLITQAVEKVKRSSGPKKSEDFVAKATLWWAQSLKAEDYIVFVHAFKRCGCEAKSIDVVADQNRKAQETYAKSIGVEVGTLGPVKKFNADNAAWAELVKRKDAGELKSDSIPITWGNLIRVPDIIDFLKQIKDFVLTTDTRSGGGDLYYSKAFANLLTVDEWGRFCVNAFKNPWVSQFATVREQTKDVIAQQFAAAAGGSNEDNWGKLLFTAAVPNPLLIFQCQDYRMNRSNADLTARALCWIASCIGDSVLDMQNCTAEDKVAKEARLYISELKTQLRTLKKELGPQRSGARTRSNFSATATERAKGMFADWSKGKV